MSPRGEIHFPLYRSEVAEAGEVKKKLSSTVTEEGSCLCVCIRHLQPKGGCFVFFFSFKFKSFKVKKCQS